MRTRTIVAVALAVVVALAVAAGVWATRGGDDPDGWSTAAGTPPGRTGDAAIAGDGTVVAVWTEERRGLTAVMSSERPPGGRWSDPVAVQPAQRWAVYGVSVAAGSRGDAAVTFRLVGRRGGRGLVLGSYRPRGGEWEAPQALTRVGGNFGETAVSVADDGGVGVVAAAVGTSTHLDAGIRDPGASWSDPAELARLRVIARPRVAMSSGAGAYVAAVEGFGRRTRLRVYTHGDGGWRPVEGPPGTSEGVGDVALALAGDGRPAIAWLHRAPQGATTLLASARDGDGWSPPRTLDRGPIVTSFGPIAASSARDGVVLAWSRWEREWTRVAVRAAIVTGAAAPPALLDAFDVPDIRAGVQVSTPGPPPTNVTVSQGGDPVVLWDRLVGRSPAFQSRLEVSRAAGDGSWTAPESVQERAIDGWPLAVGAAGDGVVAAWAQYLSPATGGLRILAAERPG